MSRFHILTLLLLTFSISLLAKDKRSRAESIPRILSSNTVGLGNIFIKGGMQTYFYSPLDLPYIIDSLSFRENVDNTATLETKNKNTSRNFFLAPYIKGTIGLTNFLHLELSSIPWTGNKIGITTAKLKCTLPGNDNLRIVGIGSTVNVTLSTEENIIASQKETPSFDPIISYTLIADLDLIKKFPNFPAKLYFNYSNTENYLIYHLFHQHTVKIGLEIKQEKYSYYLKAGITAYKPKDQDNSYISESFEERAISLVSEVGFGYRKRFSKVWPFTLNLDFEFDPINPLKFWDGALSKTPLVSFLIEVPFYFQETNTEARRAMIFVENRSKEMKTNISKRKKVAISELSFEKLMLIDTEKSINDTLLNSTLENNDRLELIEKRKRIGGLGLRHADRPFY